MCWINAFAIYYCLMAPAGGSLIATEPLDYAHMQPASLNEAAVRRVAAGDIDTARILLERAALLAPKNQVITDNLAALLVYRKAPAQITREKAVPAEAVSAGGRAGDGTKIPQASPGILPPPLQIPDIWPPK
jgi:hypothetical protein